jgi:hypothetical protein
LEFKKLIFLCKNTKKNTNNKMNTNMNQVIAGNCGSVDERGFINGFERKGFTYTRCGAELVANSCDYNSTIVLVVIDREIIRLIDNGIGMNEDKIQGMFAMFKENHTNDNSMGVSGVGAKPSIYILSKKNGIPTTVYMFTHMEGHGYIKACIPFDRMKQEGRYTGMISYDVMTDEEIARFNEERNGSLTGTTIQWVYSETTHDYFEEQFSNERKKMDMNDRLDCIFGKKKINLLYRDYESVEPLKLEMYDYFSGERPDYYTGIVKDTIHHWIDNNNIDRFTWEINDSELEFPVSAKGTSTKIEPVKYTNGWKKEGHYVLKTAMRRDERLFDDKNPPTDLSICEKTGKIDFWKNIDSIYKLISNYEQKFFESKGRDDTKATQGKMCINRNEQYVASVELEGFKIASARADRDAQVKTILHRSDLDYYTKSCQDNRMDIAIGIQENKNQHSGSFPKNLARLISHIKKERYNDILEYFSTKCKDEIARVKEEDRLRKEAARIQKEKDDEAARIQKEKDDEAARIQKEKDDEAARIQKEKDDEAARIQKEKDDEAARIQKEKDDEAARIQKEKDDEAARIQKEKDDEAARIQKENDDEAAHIQKEKDAKQKEKDDEAARIQKEKDDEAMKAKFRKTTGATQTRITVEHGIRILTNIRQQNDISSEDIIDDMIIKYSDRCAPDQIKPFINYISFTKKIDLLLELINKQYMYNNEADMKEGATLYNYANSNQ